MRLSSGHDVRIKGAWKIAVLGVFFTLVNLAFWLALIAGALFLVRAFLF